MAKYTLIDFGQQFPDDDACLLYLFKQRYGQHGPVCACGKRDTFHREAGTRKFRCAWCGAQISPTAGTIFDHFSDAAHALVLRHVPDVREQERRGRS